ncbi:MAG: copper-binding protein [Thaumarchaeota archaeon]|nr:copper-binding protein [Nitrososphaerota archaeon]
MKIGLFSVLLVSIMLLGTIPVFAQTSTSVTVTTDKPVYSDGDQMTISGTVNAQLNVPISIVVRDPSNNIVLIGQVSPDANNDYSTLVTAGGNLWTATGKYEIDVTYGSKDNTAKTTFLFTGSLSTMPVVVNGQSYNATYKITNGKLLGILPDISTKSISIRIQPSGNGTLSIILPRSLMDAKNNGQDGQFVIQNNGVSTSFNETRTDATSRTLSIPFGSDTTQITIIGTQIVPEFGTISIMILVIGMAYAILHFRTKMQSKIR